MWQCGREKLVAIWFINLSPICTNRSKLWRCPGMRSGPVYIALTSASSFPGFCLLNQAVAERKPAWWWGAPSLHPTGRSTQLQDEAFLPYVFGNDSQASSNHTQVTGGILLLHLRSVPFEGATRVKTTLIIVIVMVCLRKSWPMQKLIKLVRYIFAQEFLCSNCS